MIHGMLQTRIGMALHVPLCGMSAPHPAGAACYASSTRSRSSMLCSGYRSWHTVDMDRIYKVFKQTDMSPDGDITMNESQLLRASGTPTAATCIHDPGFRPTHSYRLAR